MKRTILIKTWMILSLGLLICTQIRGDESDWLEIPTYDLCDPGSSGYIWPDRFWTETEYVAWHIKPYQKSIPLVVTAPGTSEKSLLGKDASTVIDSGNRASQMRSGVRCILGYWFDDAQSYAAEATFLFLVVNPEEKHAASDGSPGSPFLAFPFFDATRQKESSKAIAQPGVFSGTANFRVSNYMQGVEFNGVGRFFDVNSFVPRFTACGEADLELLVGLRYWNFREKLTFLTTNAGLQSPFFTSGTKDEFIASNQFYGAQIGAKACYTWNKFFFDIKLRVAAGAMRKKIRIDGQLITDEFNLLGVLTAFPYGYLTGPTNSGRIVRTTMAFIPEVNANLGYDLFSWLRLQVGYSFLFTSKIWRAGDQLSRQLNPEQSPALSGQLVTQAAGAAQRGRSMKSTTFWAYGLNVGIACKF